MKLSETKRDLLLLLCLSAILKISISLFTEVINPDGVLYITAAQKLSAGKFNEAVRIYRMLFYPLLIALTHYLIPNWIAAAQLVSLTTSVLTLIPLYLLTKDLFDRKVALWCSAAFMISPLPNHLSVEVVRDPSYLFFFSWTVYFALCAIRSKRLNCFLLASVFSSLSLLCRLEGVVLFPSFMIFVSYLALRKPKDRVALLRGLSIYVIFPVLFFGIAALVWQAKVNYWTARIDYFNRFEIIIKQLKAILGLKFLENYHLMYEKLKIFEQSISVRGGKYFIELVRQSMLAIYFIGWLKALVDALFPPFVIPLGIGFKSSKARESAFVVLLLSFYLLMSYYSFISRGTIRTRVLLAPAFLLYPWIGAGIHRAMSFFRQGTWKRFLVIALIFLLGVLSVYKSVDIVWKQDNVTLKAGQWLKKKKVFRKAKIITTDRRVPFYAGRTKNYFKYRKSDYSSMEKLALKKRVDLLIISTSKKREHPGTRLGKFRKIKEFVGVKEKVSIYCSPKLQRTIRAKNL
jgi:4-amino-4-deoxy-L-arabinose transferase-like glycosyltransferase